MCLFSTMLFLLAQIHIGLACLGSQARQYGAPQYPVASGQQSSQYYAPASSPRAAGASNLDNVLPISAQINGQQNGQGTSAALGHNLLGQRVGLAEFSSNGYNAEGGGPVAQGSALRCDFDGRPCCWANVPIPDDQIDWQTASGMPESAIFRNVSIDGHYLVAYANNAAPSDEAQFASCSIGCSSSPIRIRTKHWQSSNVLLQVCQRESFPSSVNYNPLLNCQEYPILQNAGYTEVILPKANLVDIVFVASNFVSDTGDIAILDNIEVIYDSDPAECGSAIAGNNVGGSSGDNNVAETRTVNEVNKGINSGNEGAGSDNAFRTSAGIFGGSSNVEEIDGAAIGSGDSSSGLVGFNGRQESVSTNVGSAISGEHNALETISGSSGANGDVEHIRFSGSSVQGGAGNAKAFGVSGATGNSELNEKITSSSASASASSSSNSASSSENTIVTTIRSCQATKCTFEDGTTCGYRDVYARYENETAIHSLTNRFHVVQGQFMNRVTGVREGTEGNYYVATFLYPRERAALEANVSPLVADHRMRFQYYEGTHGVQLKACCDTDENCPFGTDKFVSVSDRMWKYGSFVCPVGTQKLIFICENTRTNQGACALDDLQVVENVEIITSSLQPLC